MTTHKPELNKLQIAGLIIATLAVIIPVMIVWETRNASFPLMVLIAAVGGAAGGALLIPGGRGALRLAGLFCGAIGGAGAFAATSWWIADRTSVMKGELALAGVIGAMPGVLLAAVIYRVLRARA